MVKRRISLDQILYKFASVNLATNQMVYSKNIAKAIAIFLPYIAYTHIIVLMIATYLILALYYHVTILKLHQRSLK